MNLESDRLFIFELNPKDIESVHKMNSTQEVEEFNTIGIPSSLTETELHLKPILEDKKNKERTLFGWSLRVKETGAFVGEIGMNLSSKKYNKAEIHYSLMPEYWGFGYASEAAREIIKFGFNVLKLHRIEAGVATENVKSIKLLEKLGMTKEGLHRKILPIRGEWKDNYGYAILAEDERNY